MTEKQWLKAFKGQLSALPAQDREQAADYYRELFDDKRDAGMSEEAAAAELGSPQEAARKVLAESGISHRPASAGRKIGGVLLMICVSIPAALCLIVLAIAGIALLVSGFALIIAGCAFAVLCFVRMGAEGFAGGLLAQAGIGTAIAAAGFLLSPLFLAATKGLFTLSKKLIGATANFIRGKREAL